MKLPWKKKEPEPEEFDSDIDFDIDSDADIDDDLSNLEDELSDIDKELKSLDKDSASAIENLDVQGHWNRKYDNFEKFMGQGGQRAITRGRKGEKGGPDEITLRDVCARAEQDILGIKLGMLNMKQAQSEGRQLLNEFKALRQAVGLRQYVKLIVAFRYSCTYEAQIGFHPPSFSDWDIDETWVDEDYLRRLQGIDTASADWKEGVAK